MNKELNPYSPLTRSTLFVCATCLAVARAMPERRFILHSEVIQQEPRFTSDAGLNSRALVPNASCNNLVYHRVGLELVPVSASASRSFES